MEYKSRLTQQQRRDLRATLDQMFPPRNITEEQRMKEISVYIAESAADYAREDLRKHGGVIKHKRIYPFF